MILSVRAYLSGFGKLDEKIPKAMDKINRREFVDDYFRNKAYEDTALPIGHGQTISQPSTVARMLQLSELKKGDSLLCAVNRNAFFHTRFD